MNKCIMIQPDNKETINSIWVKHSEPGCKERVAVIDGNEKLHRLICGAEKKHITGSTGQVNYYDM